MKLLLLEEVNFKTREVIEHNPPKEEISIDNAMNAVYYLENKYKVQKSDIRFDMDGNLCVYLEDKIYHYFKLVN